MGNATRQSPDAPSRVTRRHHYPTETEPISYTILKALAAAENVPVTELGLCLADYVDIDALNDLFERSADTDADVSLSFTLDKYTVHVKGSGQITVTENQ